MAGSLLTAGPKHAAGGFDQRHPLAAVCSFRRGRQNSIRHVTLQRYLIVSTRQRLTHKPFFGTGYHVICELTKFAVPPANKQVLCALPPRPIANRSRECRTDGWHVAMLVEKSRIEALYAQSRVDDRRIVTFDGDDGWRQ
jgi:hypothetical protein